MESLNEFPEDYSETFKYSFHLLSLCNIRYFQDSVPFVKKYFQFSYMTLAALIHLIIFTMHLVGQLSKGEMIDVAYMLLVHLVCVRSVLKAWYIMSNNKETSEIISDLGFIWRTKYTKEQITEKNKLYKTLNICISVNYWVGAYLGIWQFLTAPLLETLFRRYVLHQESELKLPVSYPFDFGNNWLFYIPVYAFQCYVMAMTVYIHIGSWMLMITLCGLLVIEFAMLQDDLSHIKPTHTMSVDISDDINRYSIGSFIQRHQKLIRLSKQLDNVYNRIIFIDLLFVGIITCAFTFAGQFARSKLYTLYNYVAVTCSMVTVFCVCYYGEQLTDASERMGDVAYNNLWYKGDLHYNKAIWLIMKISRNPCCLTSLRYVTISLRMFSKVISTTWSYLSLMNTVFAEED